MNKVIATVSASLALLSLAGCAPLNVSYELRFSPAGFGHEKELTDAAERVVEGRVGALNKKVLRNEEAVNGTGAILRFALSDPSIVPTLTTALTSPFSFRVMKEAPKDQADIYNDQFGGFKETGLTEKQVEWVQTGNASGSTMAYANVTFSKAGQDAFNAIVQQNLGKQLGIFVRGRLMSHKILEAADARGFVEIDGIPSPGIAAAFADDVNTGVHVTFVPLSSAK